MAVVAVARPDLDSDEYRSQLWAVPTDASAPARPLTEGHQDSAPAFSPDGRWLAYLSAEPGGRPQVWVLPTAGGAGRRLTDHHLGAGAPVWSPDSRRLAYTARVPEEGRYGTVEGVGPGAEPPRLITTLQYRRDGVGFLTDRPSQVFVARSPRRLRRRHRARPGARPGHHRRGRLHRRRLAARRGRARLRVRPASVCRPRPGPRRLRRAPRRSRACAGSPHPGATARCRPTTRPAAPSTSPPSPIWARTGWTSSPARPCPAGSTPTGVSWSRCSTPRTTIAATRPLRRSCIDGGVLVGVQRRGAVELLRVPLDGGAPESLVDGPFTVRSFAAGVAWSSRSSRTTGRRGSSSRSPRAGAGC